MPTDRLSTWLRFAQFADPPHNPTFPGYRRTLQSMPRDRDPFPWFVLAVLCALGAIAIYVGVHW